MKILSKYEKWTCQLELNKEIIVFIDRGQQQAHNII